MTSSATRLWCCLSVCLFFGVVSPAWSITNSHWSVRTWRSDDGLPNNQVMGLAQTADGYLWVATYAGPARFDGVQFEEFSPAALTGGASDKSTCLLLSRDGGLWIALLQGRILRVAPGGAQTFSNGLSERVVRGLVEDFEGSLWIVFQGGLVCRLKDGVAQSFTVQDGWPPMGVSSVASLACDANGRIWFSKAGRVGVFRNERFVTLWQFEDTTARLAPSRNGGVWLCSGSQLYRLEEGGRFEEHGAFHPRQPGTVPTALMEDSEGGVWIGTSESGLFRYDGSDYESIPVPGENILALLQDQEGNVWCGSESGGLSRMRPRTVRLDTPETGLPAAGIFSMTEDSAGNVWGASKNGMLARWTDGQWKIVSEDWPGGRVSAVAAGMNGELWIGTRDRSLHQLCGGIYTTWRHSDGLIGREVRSLLVSRAGDVWIGGATPDAIQRLRGGVLTTFEVPPGLRVVRALAEDHLGNIWAGTSKGVLLKISPDGVVTDETERTTPSLSSIRTLHATPDGSLWLGYADNGLGWLNGDRFGRVSSKQGLIDDTISQIIADGQGWLWFGSDQGVFKARKDELELVAMGRRGKVHCIRYGQSEGLFSLEAITDVTPGALRRSDGSIWIPMRTGLAMVDPRPADTNRSAPSVLLKQVATDERVVASYGGALPVAEGINLGERHEELRLKPGHRSLRFEFTALSFSAPENVVFRYRLEPFDREWIEAGAQRNATYPRLPQGKYQFRVTACNSAGIWNDEGAVFAFSVIPFFWQTWWFRSAVVLACFGTTVGVVRYASFRRLRSRLQRLEQQAALDRERARIARDIHDDLGGRLTEVELLIAMAQQAATAQRDEAMTRMASAVQQAGESLDEIVWAVNPKHDSLPHLVNYLGQYAIHFLDTAEIRCLVDLPECPPEEPVPPEVRHNLYLAVKEALNNVARHSQATEVWLRVSLSPGWLQVRVEDNGRGLRPSDDPGADGLGNMRQRMEAIRGRFEVESLPSGGTAIVLTLQWPPHFAESAARENGLN